MEGRLTAPTLPGQIDMSVACEVDQEESGRMAQIERTSDFETFRAVDVQPRVDDAIELSGFHRACA